MNFILIFIQQFELKFYHLKKNYEIVDYALLSH